jgi:predicted enzyme related to lactoylglutathione lyase
MSDITRRTAGGMAVAGATAAAALETCHKGRFAKLSDPEGNPIQLWQPGGEDPG